MRHGGAAKSVVPREMGWIYAKLQDLADPMMGAKNPAKAAPTAIVDSFRRALGARRSAQSAGLFDHHALLLGVSMVVAQEVQKTVGEQHRDLR